MNSLCRPLVAAEILIDVRDFLPDALELGLPHRFAEMILELGGHAARLRRHGADGAQRFRQILRADGDQRHRANDHHLAPGDVEHVNPAAMAKPRVPPAQPVLVSRATGETDAGSEG